MAGFVGVILFASVYSPEVPVKPECRKLNDSGTEQECTVPMALDKALPAAFFGTPTVTGIAAVDGIGSRQGVDLMFVGTLPLETIKPPLLTVDNSQFTWDDVGTCSEPVVLAPVASVTVGNQGQETLNLCDTAPRGPSDIFSVQTWGVKQVTPGASAVFDVTGAPNETYFADPYPLQLLVKSNGGARAVTIPKIAQLGDAERQKLQHNLERDKKIRCGPPLEVLPEPWRYRPPWEQQPWTGPAGRRGRDACGRLSYPGEPDPTRCADASRAGWRRDRHRVRHHASHPTR